MPVQEAPLALLGRGGLLIGSHRVITTSGGVHQHVYPATGRPTVEVPLAGKDHVDEAVAAARAALPAWRGMGVDERRDTLLRFAAIVRSHSDEIGSLQVAENATPMWMASAAVLQVAGRFEYYAGWADKIGGEVVSTWPLPGLDYTLDEPYGVIAIIVPWNGPMSPFGSAGAAALAAGNCIVVKPPELTPFTLVRLAELALEAGFPPGVINVIPGGPTTGDALVRHPGVDKIHFTGSGPTAKKMVYVNGYGGVPR